MRVRLRTRQMATVVALVAASVMGLAALHLSTLVQIRIEESTARAELLARTVFQRAQQIVPSVLDPRDALREDAGIRAILESSIAYTRDVAYAAIVDTSDVVITHSTPGLEGTALGRGLDLATLIEANTVTRLRALYREQVLEVDQPVVLGDMPFGAIRIGLSPVLMRADLERFLQSAAIMVGVTLVVAMLLSGILAHWALRPIHLIRAGLSRLEGGERGVQLDLPADPDLAGVERSFEVLSTRLAADRREAAAGTPSLATDRLEDAVAVIDGRGVITFANAAMRALLPAGSSSRCRVDDVLPRSHPCQQAVHAALKQAQAQGPDIVTVPTDTEPRQCQVTAHVILGEAGAAESVLLVVRDVGYVRAVESTLRSSRQLASMGRLLAGVAHEVKNPINAMLIHLELLETKLTRSSRTREQPVPVGSILGVQPALPPAAGTASEERSAPPEMDGDRAGALTHLAVLGAELRRLDDVIQGLLRFMRPREFERKTVMLADVVDEVCALVQPEAHRRGVILENRCADRVPPVGGDRGMLRQVLLNLALNACQAMPSGGTLRISAGTLSQSQVWVDVEDTGTGMSPDELARIFDLYYTTKEGGSGIGLSLVYRIVLLHDGDIDVESTPGDGTRFRVTLPRASTEGDWVHGEPVAKTV